MALSIKRKLIADVFAVFLFSLVFYIFLLAYITYIDLRESSSALSNLIFLHSREKLALVASNIDQFIESEWASNEDSTVDQSLDSPDLKKKEILERLNCSFLVTGSELLLVSFEGEILNGSYTGRNISEWLGETDPLIDTHLSKLALEGGGFLEFERPEGLFKQSGRAGNYIVPLSDWEIYAIIGFYTDELSLLVEHEQSDLSNNLRNIALVSLLLYLLLAIVIFLLLANISKRLEKGLDRISLSLIDSMNTMKPLKTDSLEYSNFIEVAERANELILQRNIIEKKLTLSRERYVNIFNASNEGFILFDEDLNILDINTAALRFYDLDRESCLKGYISSSYFGIDEYLKDIDEFPFGPLSFQRQYSNNNDVFWLENIVSGMYLGEEKRYLLLSRNISERMRMHNILMETEKMKTVGGLAAGVAHEINNPLGIILQSVENTRRRLSPELKANITKAEELGIDFEKMEQYLESRKINSYLEYIKDASIRAAEIIKRMLNFSRVSESKMAPIDIIELMERTLELVASDYEMKKNYNFNQVVIEREYQNEMPLVPLTATEIEQVFIHIIKNAVQAMSGQSMPRLRITICTARNQAEIRIFDNGPPIKPDVRRHMFDPFFTTKEAGSGTGLGLSVSYFIVKNNHKGDLVLENMEEGPVFIITLPLSREDVGNE